MKRIAIITARGGSKRIPGKNIRNFLGKPIIEYSIRAALDSRLFDVVMVSTDDEEIAAISVKAGAAVPFFRSAKNSDDYATTADVLKEVLEEYRKDQHEFDEACCIYPTAPFITAAKLNEACEMLSNDAVETVMVVSKFSVPAWWAMIKKGDVLEMLHPETAMTRSQDLSPTYYDCGQFYFFKISPFLKSGLLVGKHTAGYEVPETEVQDIDNLNDWKMAELKYKMQTSINEI